MPVFIDYRYVNWFVPAVGGWGSIVGSIERRHPNPFLANPPLSPSKENVADTGATPKRLWWSMRTTGHGSEAEMAIRWYLESKLLTKPDLTDLSRFTTQRTHLAMTVFQATKTGAEYTHLRHRRFLPLIDPSEKGLISYLVGCGLAGVCGPSALKVRTPAAKIKRLFHASLFRTHTSLFTSAIVDTLNTTEPDFIGFDELDQIHVFEAKASFGRINYKYVIDGLQQVIPVQGIKFSNPAPSVTVPAASLNVCFSFQTSTPVNQWPLTTPPVPVPAGTRCAVFEYVVPQGAPPVALASGILQRLQQLQVELLGIQIFGLWIASLSADRVDIEGQWAVHHFQIQDKVASSIAIPAELFFKWNALIEPLLDTEVVNANVRRRPFHNRREQLIGVLNLLAACMLACEEQLADRKEFPPEAVPVDSWRVDGR